MILHKSNPLAKLLLRLPFRFYVIERTHISWQWDYFEVSLTYRRQRR